MRLTTPFSFLRASRRTAGGRRAAAGTTLLAGALLLGATLGMGKGAHSQPPTPAPTPPPPQKPLPTLIPPPVKDGRTPTDPTTYFQVVTPTDKQSPVNPFPFGAGNAQGRGVGSADMYWGMTNANVPYYLAPASRIPNLALATSTTRNFPLVPDGWTFTAGLLGFDPTSSASERRDPRANDPRSGTRDGVFLNQTRPFVINDDDVRASNTAQVLTIWPTVTTPSVTATPGYSRAAGVTRPNTTALDYITRPDPTTNPRGFRYRLNNPAVASTQITGTNGQQTRLRISMSIPTLGDDTEARVNDARYFVFYYIRSATTGAILPKYKVFIQSQNTGEVKFLNADGSEAIFPFFSNATDTTAFPVQPGLNEVFQGVIVDDTYTDADTTGTPYVLADRMTLTSSTGTISVTPTIVGPHGGRKNTNYNVVTGVAGVPILPGPTPGVQPQQPRSYVPRLGAPYDNKIINEPLISGIGNLALTNDSYTDTNANTGMVDSVNTPSYINNPRDPIYAALPPAPPAYDGRIPFESWNPSTLFMGPEALLDPRRKTDPNSPTEVGLPLRAGTENRPLIERRDPTTGGQIPQAGLAGGVFRTPANASDANNFNVYGGAFNANSTSWTPYFSQMQVIVARTEFVPNPETNVPDDLKDGTLTIQVGAVYALDWQTGAPIWRFPDKTYLPGRARNPRILQGIPNDPNPIRRQDVYQVPNIVVIDSNGDGSNAAIDPSTASGQGRIANDTTIEDEEVFIGQLTGSSSGTASRTLGVGTGSGALFASITFAPRVPVQGRVQLPTYQISNPPALTQFNRTGRYIQTNVNTTVDAPVGRYFTHITGNRVPYDGDTTDSRGAFGPVLTGMLYIASNNGVIYAIDAFGNNDNYYAPYHPNLATPNVIDNGVFGNYQPGTTNVLWTFSPTSGGRRQSESLAAYYARLKMEVPATSGFGASAPVLAYAKDERDNTSATETNRINPFTDELRLFAGNSNGVLYALDASAKAGTFVPNPADPTTIDVRPLPFRKGEQVGFVPDDDVNSGVSLHRTDLKWWFRTRSGAINYPATVSLMKQNAGGTAAPTKGVYVSSQEGRVYCVDFFGPVTRADHSTPVATATGWDGTGGTVTSPPAGSAAALNDDFYFHNTIPATANARGDLTEGTVRPRWAWPNLYRNVRAAGKTILVAPDGAIDNANRRNDVYNASDATGAITGVAGRQLSIPEALGPPTTSPVLMDFLWKDPLVLTAGVKLRSYVAVVVTDPIAAGEAATGSRVYLLDQIGDRENFLSGTQATRTGANAPITVRGQYVDRFTPNALLSDGDVNGLTPTGIAWSYRMQYDVYPGNGPRPLGSSVTDPTFAAGRNSPTTDPFVLSGIPNTAAANNNAFTGTSTNLAYSHYRDENYGRPERRTLPTLFVGGSTGNLLGLDIDPETGIFLRWRPTLAETRQFASLPYNQYLTDAGVGVGDNLFPGPNGADDLPPINANPTDPNDPFNGSATRALLRNRRVLARSVELLASDVGAVANLTISGGPSQNRNNITPIVGATPVFPTVPTYPTNDVPVLRPFLLTGSNDTTQGLLSYDPDIYSNTDVREFGHSSRVNQDINDSISTTRGSVYSDVPLGPNQTRFIQAETAQRFFNQSYEYPTLFVTTTSGFLNEISTNIEGQDFSTYDPANPLTTSSAAVGWGLQGLGRLEQAYNIQGHVHQMQISLGGGSGGPVAGVAVVTPAYFPALDPSFTNPQRVAAPATVPADNFRNYPYGSPNVVGTPGGATTPPTPNLVTTGNNDDPRPDFHVRPLSPGAVAQAGPDGVPNTADDIPFVLPDRHTGQTGFPLDLNGLFFDKRFAGLGTRATTGEIGVTVYNESFIEADPATGQATAPFTPIVGQNAYTGAYPYPALDGAFAATPPVVRPVFQGQDPNGDFTVGVRLPAYSDIGTSLDTVGTPVNQLFNNQQADGLRANRRTGNLVPLLSEVATGLSTLETGARYNNDPLNNLTRGDDINPAGQNVTWIYTGGANGMAFAYTPSIPGQQSGLGGGTQEIATGFQGDLLGNNSLGGLAQIDLYDQANYDAIRNSATSPTFSAPDRTKSIAATGGRNFYEWGETAYIVLSNFQVGRTPSTTNPLNSLPVRFNDITRIGITIKSRFSGAIAFQGDIAPLRNGSGIASYEVPEDDGSITKYGVAVLAFRLDRPSSAKPLTPGDVYDIAYDIGGGGAAGTTVGGDNVTPTGARGGAGATPDQQANNSPAASFAIANPIAVQAFGVQTGPSQNTGQVMPVGIKHNAGVTAGGIGPFFADSNQTGTANGTKGEVRDSRNNTNVDPNEPGSRYSQALTQGNLIRRRELSAILVDASAPGGIKINPRFPQILKDKDGSGSDEPRFYLPVASGVGYIDHGTSGSTTKGNVQLLRVGNRSLLPSLPNIRIQAVDPLLWHAWPGQVPNTEGDLPAIGVNPALNHNNPRLTPVGMDLYGRINPLAWETGVNENEPYNSGSLANQSPDYPDIILQRTTSAPRVFIGGTDVSNTTGSLPTTINANGGNPFNSDIQYFDDLTRAGGLAPVASNQAVSITLTIPKYQPANLAAIHTLTSVYQIANQQDDPASNGSLDIVGGAGTPGPVQLPRGYASRLLYEANPTQPAQGALFDGPQAISPWGYSTKMVAYVDIPGLYNGSLYPIGQSVRVSGTGNTVNNSAIVKAYREFEVWVGVPAAMSLRMVEKEVDLGAEGHGFAMQQGLLGYGPGNGAYASGFLPTPLYNATAFPAVGNIKPNPPYSNFFKGFTAVNDGNINLWNLRASQKIEMATSLAQAGTGQPFQYFGMRSDSVDSRFGILAVGADPFLASGLMPQVVTSLDQSYDPLWNTYVANLPAFQAQYNGANSDPYTRYYAAFQGHHTLHKALPGATSPSVLGIPDIPTAQNVYDIAPDLAGQAIPPAPPSSKTVVGVAVPLGTPSGLYHSNLAQSPLVVFEDHDTDAGYNAVPTVTANGNLPTLSPAGPLYGGRNNYYFADPSAPTGAVQVRTKGGTTDGTLRARRYNDATKKLEYQPYTDPTFDLRVTVKETGLTGQAADRALAAIGGTYSLPPVISTGVLPSVDPFPLIQTITGGNQTTGGDLYRAASALTPAAYRSANGTIHVYFPRNAANGTVDTQPGRPYGLFASHLNWNQNLGVFVANNVGVPIAGDARNNTTGSWFTNPTEITPAGVPAGSSNLTPFVLQESVFNAGLATPGAATLFFMNSTPTVGGAPVNIPYFAPLDINGGLTSQAVPYFDSASPTLQRYAPRAAYVKASYDAGSASTGTTFLFYYGGVPGRWNIYYSPRAAGVGGAPTDTAANAANGRAEIPLQVPTAIVSASDPTPVVRRLYQNPNNVTDVSDPAITVIDLYYTGVSRATQTPDVYMTRYELQGGNGGAGQAGRLVPITLPRVYGERLTAPGRDPLWQARHISWVRELSGRNALPRIYLPDATSPTGRREVTDRNNWRYDNASGLLYQTFLYNKNVPQSLTTVYIDTSAGTVRFRGAGTPRNTDTVYADYQPQTYRITGDGASNAGTFSLVDQSVLPATLASNPVNAIVKRSQPMYADRQYILYQKGAQPGKPATLFYSARRVGVDLKTLTTDANGVALGNGAPLAANETIALSVPTAGGNFNSTPQVSVVGITNATFDVDITNGRLYVAPTASAAAPQSASLENVQISFSVTVAKPDGTTRTLNYNNVRLTYLDEKRDVAVPMTQAVNEGQPYAFIDGFVPTVSRTNPNPNGDPTLQPGRMWLFWSTPRGREGTVIGPGSAGGGAIFDPFPSAYDIFWQTLAPQFDPLLYTISR